MQEFVRHGGLLIADGEPGTFDEHSRRLAGSQLAGSYTPFAALDYHQQRLMGKEGETKRAMGRLLAGAGVKPEFAVVDSTGGPVTGVETHTFRNGDVFLVGLLSNPQLRVDELGPPEFQTNAAFEKSREVVLRLPAAMECWDVRTGKALGRKGELALRVNPYDPVLIAVSARSVPELRVSAPARVVRGGMARIGIGFVSSPPAGAHVFHVEVRDPSGKQAAHYSGNVLSTHGLGEKVWPLSANDVVGRWTVGVRDAVSGQVRVVAVEVD